MPPQLPPEISQRDCTGGFRDTLHRERGGLTTTRGCLFRFVRKKTAHAGEINGEKSSRPLSARAPFFFVDGGSAN